MIEILYLPVDSLQPYDRNTRAHNDYDVSQIAESIRKFGFNDPVGIWGSGNIIVEGHGRVLAARSIGMETVPCIRLDHLTDEQRREYAIMHNKTAELSDWDFAALEAELEELDLSAFDIDFGIQEEETPAQDEEPEPLKGDGENKGSLAEQFGIPPFSVIYTTKGDWPKLKKLWIQKGIRSGLGRGGATRLHN